MDFVSGNRSIPGVFSQTVWEYLATEELPKSDTKYENPYKFASVCSDSVATVKLVKCWWKRGRAVRNKCEINLEMSLYRLIGKSPSSGKLQKSDAKYENPYNLASVCSDSVEECHQPVVKCWWKSGRAVRNKSVPLLTQWQLGSVTNQW